MTTISSFLWLIIFSLSSTLNVAFGAKRQLAIDPTKIVYRQATLNDLKAIELLQDEATIEDRKKLLILPDLQRRESLMQALNDGVVFVAVDPAKRTTRTSGNIISVLKVFVLGYVPGVAALSPAERYAAQDAAENKKQTTLFKELRCRKTHNIRVRPAMALKCEYNLELDSLFAPREEPVLTDGPDLKYSYNEKQTYVYLGGSFTTPLHSYRGHFINSRLECFALRAIKKDILADIVNRQSEKLFYVYGIVEAGSNRGRRFPYTTQHIRTFSYCVQGIKGKLGLPVDMDDPIELNYFAFDTFKPAFFIDEDGQLNQKPDPSLRDSDYDEAYEERKGFGVLIECPLYGAVYPDLP